MVWRRPPGEPPSPLRRPPPPWESFGAAPRDLPVSRPAPGQPLGGGVALGVSPLGGGPSSGGRSSYQAPPGGGGSYQAGYTRIERTPSHPSIPPEGSLPVREASSYTSVSAVPGAAAALSAAPAAASAAARANGGSSPAPAARRRHAEPVGGGGGGLVGGLSSPTWMPTPIAVTATPVAAGPGGASRASGAGGGAQPPPLPPAAQDRQPRPQVPDAASQAGSGGGASSSRSRQHHSPAARHAAAGPASTVGAGGTVAPDVSHRQPAVGRQQREPPETSGQQARVQALEDENRYLKKNVEHLRQCKHALENQVRTLEGAQQRTDRELQNYKALHDKAQRDAQHRREKASSTGSSAPSRPARRPEGLGSEHETMEIENLQEQLDAVERLKEHFYKQIVELEKKLEAAQQRASAAERAEGREGGRQGHGGATCCVICMDNLANLVCLPCKHLALCAYCGEREAVTDCPICRAPVIDKMQVYTP